MEASQFDSICSQLLTKEDLQVSKELVQRIENESIVTEIVYKGKQSYIKIYALKELYLSSIIPILHNFGFEIIDEITYNIPNKKELIYITRFNLNLAEKDKLDSSKENVEFVITDALKYEFIKRTKLFSLVYKQNLSLRSITLLSAIIEYLDQAVISLNTEAIINTLTCHDEIANQFVDYFHIKFNPKATKREKQLLDLEAKIEENIKNVPNILDDKILKLTYALLQALIRTNFYFDKESIAFKIDSKKFSENLKGLQPNIESFVYHHNFYGLHLRMTNISRGGLRWSDRHDDYRQEIKSLMITQEGKNSIIIPSGAKGGFVINKPTPEVSKEFFEEVYRNFINNLLDLVDNMKNGEIVRDKRIVAYDGDDAYFVVAADKGTAAMSDVANSIAIERDYWLGDAFASGGSNGFGHKDLGITARGAIMSTKRFFIEEGIDIYKDPISVVGIGSMNGDVFGNGLIESKAFKLVAAIGHKDIFIDPEPDLEKSYEERKRLFFSGNGGWSNYDTKLISKGGGVFLRATKEIELSEEIKKLIGTAKKSMSGEELCRKLLTMKVDLLFNGGVGTYVKSSEESNLDLGDKQNEAVRVDASDLKARIVSEGGNLGFTQKARIEYAMRGGKINIDGIDNAGGVNTSDHEVNLKILLNTIQGKGIICADENKTILSGLTEQVVNLVLWNNYEQALTISRDEELSQRYLSSFQDAIQVLEDNVVSFNRHDFFIPKNENIHEIINKNGSIVRPILCNLLSYSKIFMKALLLESKFIDEAFPTQYLYKYFPKSFVGAYEHEITSHPLKREIIATKIADIVLNSQGITFICDYDKLGFDKFILKIKSYLIASNLFSSRDLRFDVYRNDYKLAVEDQYNLLNELEHTLNFTTKWMVKYSKEYQIEASHILDHKDELFEILGEMSKSSYIEIIANKEYFNLFYGVIDYLNFAIAAIMIKEKSLHSFRDVIIVFYSLIREFKILELIDALNQIKIADNSEAVLKRQILKFIEFIVVHYTEEILKFKRVNETPEAAFENYLSNEEDLFNMIKVQINEFMAQEKRSLQEITITVNQMLVALI
ncbi:NAD-glutamate dehydrogenase domain-containing protein [Candidatus Marinarcus aquaticus]|uniref:Glutamate dehydrogenase n=1 Tax=Candidatus Marinarcus aquaticus TaxID=2044504 RepID=A0A4Q0XUW4_9BACT|nr:NAD-glutamate dehydrogenase domain-containing protein [Candidatus Marinarcus aquaticus]RXJ60755.1 glutamate dehydrogenase [Candidatus Marinarcus aquaticus]